MRVLIIKTSSLGDVIHTLPALTDAMQAIPGIRFDWAVEEAFAEIPSWHPAVDKVIPVAIRRWRRTPIKSMFNPEWKRCKHALRKGHYDAVIDAQGLSKSAWLAGYAQAPCYGYDRNSAREPLASLSYKHKISVPKNLHAVERIRQLFAKVLKYKVSEERGSYSLDRERFRSTEQPAPTLVFLHGTARDEKLWPETHWQALAKQAVAAGYQVQLPWGSEAEHLRAKRIAEIDSAVSVLPRLNLKGIATVLMQAKAVVGVDTGLAHLAAALDIPAVALYGPTNTELIGTYGAQQVHILSPIVDSTEQGAKLKAEEKMAAITADLVWKEIGYILAG